MTRQIEAGRAFVRVGTEGSIKGGLDKAARALRRFGSVVTSVAKIGAGFGAGLAASLGAVTAKVANANRDLHNMSLQVGASVEELTRLQYAAKRLGLDADGPTSDLIGLFEELNIRMGEAIQDGTGPLVEAFAKLGLSADELAKVPLSERLAKIGEELNKLSEIDRGFLADEIFGGDAFKVLPLLRQGADGIRQLTKEADRLGATVSTRQAAASAELVQSWGKVRAVVGGLVNDVGSTLAESIVATVQTVQPKIEGMVGAFDASGVKSFNAAIANTVRGFAVVADSLDNVRIAFNFVKLGLGSLFYFVNNAFLQMGKFVLRVGQQIAKTLDKLPGVDIKTGDIEDNAFIAASQGFIDGLRKELEDTHQQITNLTNSGTGNALRDVADEIANAEAVIDTPPQVMPREIPKPVKEAGRSIADIIAGGIIDATEAANKRQQALFRGVEELAKTRDEESSARGTFSGAAARMLGRSGDTATKQLETQRRAEELLRRLVDMAKRNGLAWGP